MNAAEKRCREIESETVALQKLLSGFRSVLLSMKEERSELRSRLERDYPPISPTLATASTVQLASSPNSNSSTSNGGKTSGANTNSSAQRTAKTWSLKLFPNSAASSSPSSTPLSISAPYNCQTNYHLIYNNSRLKMAAGRGCLIVLEGLDRVGKSTLALKLVDYLSKYYPKVDYLKFPERSTPTGQLIDTYLKNNHDRLDKRTVHLLYSANRWEYADIIKKKIKNGTTLVVDRYIYSGIAYSVAKGLSLQWCHNVEIGLPKPDVVIYLQASRNEQALRPGFGDERFEKSDFQDKVRETYELLIGMNSEGWLRFDVDHKTPEEVLEQLILPVKGFIEKSATKKLGKYALTES